VAGLCVLLCATSAQAAVRHIVLIQSVERGNLTLDRFTELLRAQIDQQGHEPVNFTEFVVTPEGFVDYPQQAIVDYIRASFAGRPKPDLVITTGGPAATFARKYRTQLFPDSPFLYAAVDQRFLQGVTLTDSETAVAVANDYVGVVGEIQRLFPATENVYVMLGAGDLGRFWRREFEAEFHRFGRLRFIWPDGMSYAQMLQRAATLPPRSAIFFISIDLDVDGTNYPTGRVLEDLRARGNAPVFGAQSAELGYGIIGGNLISIEAVSSHTTEAALRILAGASPGTLTPPVQPPGPRVYDWRELQRWGVSEVRLPAGSTVQFRERSVWERSKWLIVGGVSGLAAQMVLIGALLVGRAQRRQAERALRESEGRFRVLADSAPVLIRMTGVEARSTDFNVPWLNFTGRNVEAERGDGWLESVHPEDVAGCISTHRRAFDRREPYRVEYRLRRADGEYRWLLDSGKPLFTSDGAFAGFIGSAIDITDLKAARETLSNLNRRLMEAQEQERSRVARELHDDVGQRIVAVSMGLGALINLIAGGDRRAVERVQELGREVQALVGDVSQMSHRLHSSVLEPFGLASAAQTLCREMSTRHNVAVEFVDEDVPPTLPDGVALNVFRVLQEALSNAVKHSGSYRYDVTIRGWGDRIQLDVRDQGRGFDPAVALATSGLGLVSMQERLRFMNGEVTIESSPGKGTTVRATIPLRAA
jgi:PAS domain S-box-containing protein